jgi:hypothetical protein
LAALQERGLRPVSVQFAESHIPVDITCASLSMLGCLSPEPRLPWRTVSRGKLGDAWHKAVWWKAYPKLLPLTIKADAALAPIVHRTGDANLYRVLARKD